uniref:Uncharacterized protein n=1 Tax=Anopheles dirus TaxID=7168 RepID=A0A182NWI2_9DIPT
MVLFRRWQAIVAGGRTHE